jgi:F-type H+-transporting ATPase subunit delta
LGSSVVSKRYAKALIDLATQEGIVDQIERNFGKTVLTIVQTRNLRNFFFNPVYKSDEKMKLLDMVVKEMAISGLLKKFLEILIKKDRFPEIQEIYKEYVRLSDQLNNRAEAEITSAAALNDEDKKKLQSRLEALTGKNIYLNIKQDPTLIGGVITRIGSVVYDGSIKSQLARLKEQIMTSS